MAHQDDDLYFLNPLLVSQLRSNEAHLTVCLTAGEADGRNAPGGTREHAATPVDFEGFAAARYNGLRCAYADMVLGDRDAQWHREVVVLDGGAEADVSVLVDAPHIRLVSLNLWCSPPPDAAAGTGSLPELWSGQAASTPTMIPLGSPVTGTHAYSREGLIESLVMLLRSFEPTLLWTMDPDPDWQVHDEANPRHADSGNYSDHIFHTVTALFTYGAASRWFAEGGGGQTSVEAFRGYYVRRWPSNLSPEGRTSKQRYKDVYGWADRRPTGDPAGLGDRKVSGDPIAAGNASGTTLRYPGSRSWARPASDGTLSAFAVRGGRVVQWREARHGGFLESRPVPGGGLLLPHVDVVPHGDAGWRLFAVHQGLAADPDRHVRDLWTTVVPASGDVRNSRWESLGNPAPTSAPAKRRHVGMPQVVPLGDGRLLVLVRNAGKGASARLYQDSTWTPWRDLGGEGVQDGLTALALDDGSVEVLAAAGTGVARWLIRPSGGDAAFSVIPTEAPAGPPTVVALPGGDRMMFYRRRDSASVVSLRAFGATGWDLCSPVDLGGHGGPGPIAAQFVPGADAVLVAVRDDDSATSVTWVDLDGRGRGAWMRHPTPIAGSHAVSIDSAGRPIVLAVSAGGGLLILLVDQAASSVTLMKEAQ
ncbi:PIG-L family deacetylase [Micromonospora globbae]|nr:PIG-L family deacetylase [Micromonospora globbae]